MSGFVRPEIAALWRRWRAVLLGVAIAGLGGAYGLASDGLLRALGLALGVAGVAWTWDSLRRARFPEAGGGPGVVDMVERRLRYFGPHWGGAVSLDELARVQIRSSSDGPLSSDLMWEFTQSDGQRLSIPGDAEGADVIFDALTALPGVNYDAVTQATLSTKDQAFQVWVRRRASGSAPALPPRSVG